MKQILTYIVITCFLCSSVLAQNEKKLEKWCNKAMKSINSQDYTKAAAYLEKAFAIDSNWAKAHILHGDVLALTLRAADAADAYNRGIALSKKPKPMLYFVAAEEEVKCGRYEAARDNYNRYLDNLPKNNPTLRNEVEKALRNCDFAINAVKQPRTFEPVNLGSNINSDWDEYLPALTADESELILTVRRPRDEKTICNFCATEEDFYSSVKKEGVWQPRQSLGAPINTSYNEGAQCISPDGHYLFYTLCNTENGYGSCDLFWAKRIGNRWSRPKNFGASVNTKYWESQPTVAPDGRTIYFVSNRPGGYGGMDIWKTEMVEEGVFTIPTNIGNVINTPDDDTAPFIHADGRTLYFVSDGHPGMGGKDLFFSMLAPNNEWQTPVNLGYPINTYNDEINIMVNAAGTTGYFSSDKEGGYGGQDLYAFTLDPAIRPTPVTYFKGIVQDAATLQPIAADIELINLDNNQLITATKSDPLTGEFLACILTGSNILLNVSHPHYPFFSENFQLEKSYSELAPFEKNVLLHKPEVGTTFILRNIFFDFDKSDLKSASHVELMNLVDYLKKNRAVRIEIGGHTDNQGSADYNLQLSLARAEAVYNFLISKGIAKERLAYKGYGMSAPIVPNDSEENRARNRRTEFTIMNYE